MSASFRTVFIRMFKENDSLKIKQMQMWGEGGKVRPGLNLVIKVVQMYHFHLLFYCSNFPLHRII